MTNTMIHTPDGTLYFDALIHADHTSNVTVTEHAVQTGAAISDHALIEPQEVSLEIGMTDTIGGDGSSARAYQQFLSLMRKRQPCTVVTRIGTYQNMVLTSISTPDDYTTAYGLRATLAFKEVRIVSVAVLKAKDDVSASKTLVDRPGMPRLSSYKKSDVRQSALEQAAEKQYSSTIKAAKQKNNESVRDADVVASVQRAQAANAAKGATPQVSSKATVTPTRSVLAKALDLIR